MPEVEVKIWMALRDRAIKAAGPYVLIEPSSMEEPPQDDDDLLPFVAMGHVPGAVSRVFIGRGPWRYSGATALTFAAPIGRPFAWHQQKAGRIARYFGDGLVLNHSGLCVRITRRATALAGYQDGAYWRTPIRFEWESAA